MTEERAGNSPQPIIVETAVSEDRRSVILRFKGGDNGPWIIVTDTASIDALLTELGKTRSELIEPVAPNLPDGVVPIAAFNPRWYVLPDTENKFATFWVRHPGFGWAGYGFPKNEAGKIVAGAGVQLRDVPPHPQPKANGKIDIVSGRQAIIQNVYTEPEWRRRGLAALLIKRIMDWTREKGIESVVLHASDDGRAVYEQLGFIATTEMRFRG